MLNNKLKKMLFSLVAVAGGVIFIVFGAVTMKEMKNFTRVDAVVEHVQREWVPNGDGSDTQEISIYVRYTVDGKEYVEELQNTKTNLHEGDQITVLYNPEKPSEVSGASKGGAALQFAVGGVFALAGLFSLAATVIKGR